MNKILVCFINEIKVEIIFFIDKKQIRLKYFHIFTRIFGGKIFYNRSENNLRCKWHNWKFCRVSGKCLSFLIKGTLNPYNFEISPKNLNRYNSEIMDKNILIENNIDNFNVLKQSKSSGDVLDRNKTLNQQF